jgi:hypothetical protein
MTSSCPPKQQGANLPFCEDRLPVHLLSSPWEVQEIFRGSFFCLLPQPNAVESFRAHLEHQSQR